MPKTYMPALVIIAAIATSAAAETVSDYAKHTEDLRDYLAEAIDARFPIDGCKPTSEAESATCAEFVRWHQLAEAEAALTDAQQWLFFLQQIDMSTNDEENAPKLVASAKRCDKEITRLVAAGMPTDVEIRIGNSEPIQLTVKDAKAKVCDALRGRAATFANDVSAAREAAIAAAAAPYKKIGITGDRLHLLVDHVDYAMYGAGGIQLTTPRQLKTANVIFERLGPDGWGHYVVRRYQFRGDKLVGTTSGEFRDKPGSRAYR